ncbi:SGNH/GDSL hydrolase family protein [Noviherbaspirillum galbum]|uniref:SGNH/GDSL hydrolase family protein n=1 Tax=Noviherbaspirillum galbum TaxID=2709383 RepID=A0A6B3SPJ1_9BURK|nr:SGNH/GDSL hydrolase family protein [Noviherbaspirillum galbum]NEX60322.1 SGNH/GDSL hydrolase family protein [Noviherbaspirillum galbum]
MTRQANITRRLFPHVARRTVLLAIAIMPFLAACGGGGTSSTQSPVAVVVKANGEASVQAPHVIEAYGESTFSNAITGANEVERLQQLLAGSYDVINRAMPGTSSRQQFEGTDGKNLPWAEQLAASRADIIIFNRGINDANQHFSDEEFNRIMTIMITSALAAKKRVILQTPNVTRTGTALDQNVDHFAQLVRELGANLGVPVSDGHAISETMPNPVPDTIHQSEALSQAMATDLARIVRGLP